MLLRVYEIIGIDDADDMMIGMTGGCQAIAKAKDRFTKYLKLLIEIASLQTQLTKPCWRYFVTFVSNFLMQATIIMSFLFNDEYWNGLGPTIFIITIALHIYFVEPLRLLINYMIAKKALKANKTGCWY
jgi:hypothetical protein